MIVDLSDGVEVSIRQSDAHELVFVMNPSADSVTVVSAPPGTDLLTDSAVNGSLKLGPCCCAIIKRGRAD